tara:strand:- start:188 stop:523 length:336 start_codon:yes stop_codon:yes gene_type:complete
MNDNAHKQIDDLIIANTLNEIQRTKRGSFTDLLYEAERESGKKAYIHKWVDGIPKQSRIDAQTNALRRELEKYLQSQKAYPDTVSFEEGSKRLAPYPPSIMSRIMSYFTGK